MTSNIGLNLGDSQPELDKRTVTAWELVAAHVPLTPLECKAVYVSGMVRHFIESAGLCRQANRDLPAFLLTMGAVEALGAVAHSGNRSGHEAAADGLAFVAEVPRHNDKQVVVSTLHGDYTVRDCLNRRDFSAHGGAVLVSGVVLDPMLTVGLLCLTVTALDRWWSSLKVDLDVQRRLALAEVVPLMTEGRAVFVDGLWQALADGATPGGEVLHQSWRSLCP